MHWRHNHLDWNRIVGEQIFLRREERGMTQKQLAEQVGVNKNQISMIESGSRVPSVHTLFKISRALTCQMDCFYGPIKRENLVVF